MDISQIKKEAASSSNKVDYLKKAVESSENLYIKPEIRSLLVEAIKEKGLVKLDNEDPVSYKILYDSIGEGVEPIYFWLLEFLRSSSPSGLGLEVTKSEEGFEASASSAYFGDASIRTQAMQDRAISLLERIHVVVRTIINIIYDLKEFKIRIKSYEDYESADPSKKDAAEISLKGIWMDQVDIKAGRGSINAMSTMQGGDFITLRDGFFKAKDEKSVDSLDLNDRVKNILKRKVYEYIKWRDYSSKELRKRFNIEKNYLRSQINSLKIYTKWVKPYLRAAAKLGMKDFNSPDIVTAFNNMEMHLSLYGKKLIKPTSVFKEFKGIKDNYYACVWVDLRFITIPQAYRSQQGSNYIHGGKTEMNFKAYVFSEDEMKQIEQQEVNDDLDLAESLTNISLKELQEDIEEFLEEKPKEEKKKKPIFENPFGNPFSGFSGVIKELSKATDAIKPESGFKSGKVKDKATDTAKALTLIIYDVYKKTHGMVTW